MNRSSILFRFRAVIIGIITCVIFIIVYSGSLLYNKNSSYPTVNKGRLMTSSIRLDIEEAAKKSRKQIQSIESDIPYCIFDLKGKVVASTIRGYKKGDSYSLNESIEYDNKSMKENPELVKYMAPLIIDNIQTGTVVFLIPKEKFLPSSVGASTFLNILPILISAFLIVILSIHLYIFSKNDIIAPIASLRTSTNKILNGDFSCKIGYDYDTEIGGFCHDFEAMRDELKFSKEKEEAMKVSEKELLACLSHDIKTPLTAIHGYVSGIKDGIVKDKEGIDNYCTVTLNRVKMLNKLLEDILEHSKAELNKMNISLSEFYCGNFFSDILEDLSVEIESKGLIFKRPESIPNLLINGDRKRLSQLMYNLVSNSIKYSGKEGSVKQGQVEISFQTEGRYLKVYVKDNGMGIASADIPYIFNKFYRGEKSRNQNIQGSGLGLSICKYIAEAHGGYIECVESSAKGTVMCFWLPL